MPLFSVIVPVYKVEQYISECIESLLNQSFKNFELLLVDDGSPDNSGKICDEYAAKDSRIRVIHKKNGGVASARLAGAVAAEGQYVVCVDGDDWVSPLYLECFAKPILEYKPDIICCGHLDAYDGQVMVTRPVEVKAGLYTRDLIEKELFNILIARADGFDFPSYIWGKAILKELYYSVQLSMDKRVIIWEDEAVVKPCLYKANSIYVIENCIYYYRKNHASVTNSKKVFSLDFPMIIGQHYELYFNMTDSDFKYQLYRYIVKKLYVVASSQFYRKESYQKIADEIRFHLHLTYYKTAVRECSFKKCWKTQFKHLVLKYQLCSILWLHNKLRLFVKNIAQKSRFSKKVKIEKLSI